MTHEPDKAESTSEQTLVELESCPFCGEAVIAFWKPRVRYEHDGWGDHNGSAWPIHKDRTEKPCSRAMRGYEFSAPTEAEAIAKVSTAWNTRHHQSQQSLELEECRQREAELVEAVKSAQEFTEWFMQHSRQADHAHSELKQPLEETAGWKELIDAGYNGLMAAYRDQFDAALAKHPPFRPVDNRPHNVATLQAKGGGGGL